eukprot:1656149-Rhodomonas_salina.1
MDEGTNKKRCSEGDERQGTFWIPCVRRIERNGECIVQIRDHIIKHVASDDGKGGNLPSRGERQSGPREAAASSACETASDHKAVRGPSDSDSRPLHDDLVEVSGNCHKVPDLPSGMTGQYQMDSCAPHISKKHSTSYRPLNCGSSNPPGCDKSLKKVGLEKGGPTMRILRIFTWHPSVATFTVTGALFVQTFDTARLGKG